MGEGRKEGEDEEMESSRRRAEEGLRKRSETFFSVWHYFSHTFSLNLAILLMHIFPPNLTNLLSYISGQYFSHVLLPLLSPFGKVFIIVVIVVLWRKRVPLMGFK